MDYLRVRDKTDRDMNNPRWNWLKYEDSELRYPEYPKLDAGILINPDCGHNWSEYEVRGPKRCRNLYKLGFRLSLDGFEVERSSLRQKNWSPRSELGSPECRACTGPDSGRNRPENLGIKAERWIQPKAMDPRDDRLSWVLEMQKCRDGESEMDKSETDRWRWMIGEG